MRPAEVRPPVSSWPAPPAFFGRGGKRPPTSFRKSAAVLDFRHTSKRTRKPIPKEHRRLLVLVLLLGVVVISIDRARQPRIWQWFDRMAAPPQAPVSTNIDNRLDIAPKRDSIPDAFVATGEQPKKEKPTEKDGRYFPGVNSELFQSIRDNSLSSRQEQACTLHLLDILNKTDLETLCKASVGRVTYAQLFRQPDQYRGRLVTVSGIVRRVHRIKLFKNDYDLQEYYQIWLFPSDNPSSPMVIYCLQLPKRFPTGMDLAEEVEVTGFFFKLWAYQAKDAFRTAPTLFAKTLQWQKRPVMTTKKPLDAQWIILVVALAALSAILTALYVYLRTKPARPRPSGPSPDFRGLRLQDENQESLDHEDDRG